SARTGQPVLFTQHVFIHFPAIIERGQQAVHADKTLRWHITISLHHKVADQFVQSHDSTLANYSCLMLLLKRKSAELTSTVGTKFLSALSRIGVISCQWSVFSQFKKTVFN